MGQKTCIPRIGISTERLVSRKSPKTTNPRNGAMTRIWSAARWRSLGTANPPMRLRNSHIPAGNPNISHGRIALGVQPLARPFPPKWVGTGSGRRSQKASVSASRATPPARGSRSQGLSQGRDSEGWMDGFTESPSQSY